MANRARSIALTPVIVTAVVLACFRPAPAGAAQVSNASAEKLGWQLGPQAWSFKNFTFFEAVDKAAAMGMKYIEAYSGQKVSADIDAKTQWTMSAETRNKIKAKLKSAGVKLNAYGVVKAKNDAEWRAIFEFANDMGIGTIVCEPTPEQMDTIEKLCDEFQINAAIHDHPRPSFYWNPDTVLKVVKGRSKRIGACADTGHWMRSGLDPLECIKKLKGRIISLHLKDLNKMEKPNTPGKERTAHDVPWGTGAGKTYAIMRELARQGFHGQVSIEYEYDWDNSQPEIKQCADYFYLMATAIDKDGYKPMFKKDLSDAIVQPGGWSFEKGVLEPKGNGDIWTKDNYDNFIVDLQFKCAEDTNSGVFLRCTDTVKWLNTSIEVQIQQPIFDEKKHNCGAIFDCLAPTTQRVKEPGKWNRYVIVANDNMIYVILNGEQVLNMNLDLWTTAGKNPDGTRNKFKTAYKDMARSGHIGLQYHGRQVWFRNMRVKEL